jgi:alkanesulfonate monooxygenase SsuD/methylene tetrahydromethanopterin reductase-like flavin-dependent oxidoreductase (luciferase family)
MTLFPAPSQPGGPPIWLGSWGSDAGLRRVARLADGWLASAYNTTPEAFGEARVRLAGHLRASGTDPERFPNTLATMWVHVTEDAAAAEAVLNDVLGPTLRRSPDEMRERLLVGPAGASADMLARYEAAGAQRILLWPVGEPLQQLERFHDTVLPRLEAR